MTRHTHAARARLAAVLIAATAGLGTLAACGADEAVAPQATAPTPAGTTEAEPDADEPEDDAEFNEADVAFAQGG